MKIVQQFGSGDDEVNYTFFLQASHLTAQDQASPSMKEQIQLRISQMSEQDRQTILKLRKIAIDLS